MFAPLPLDRTTRLSPVLPPSPPSGLQPPLPIPFAIRHPPCDRFAPFSLIPLPRISLIPFFIVPNILTDSDHRESPRG